jgi:ATP-dependent Clp protease ATP-binding subunit ClpX
LPEDLLKYGLIPEFVGRLPVIATLSNLSEEDLVRILTEPKNSLVKQYKKIFAMDDVELTFKKDALKAISEMALIRKTGARGLRSIMEEIMLEVMYEIPSRKDIKRCVLSKDLIEKKMEPILVTDSGQKDICQDQEKLA